MGGAVIEPTMGVNSAGAEEVVTAADGDDEAAAAELDPAALVVAGASAELDEHDATDKTATEKNAKHTLEGRFMKSQGNTREHCGVQNSHRTGSYVLRL
jgi:hypothetical protein